MDCYLAHQAIENFQRLKCWAIKWNKTDNVKSKANWSSAESQAEWSCQAEGRTRSDNSEIASECVGRDYRVTRVWWRNTNNHFMDSNRHKSFHFSVSIASAMVQLPAGRKNLFGHHLGFGIFLVLGISEWSQRHWPINFPLNKTFCPTSLRVYGNFLHDSSSWSTTRARSVWWSILDHGQHCTRKVSADKRRQSTFHLSARDWDDSGGCLVSRDDAAIVISFPTHAQPRVEKKPEKQSNRTMLVISYSVTGLVA